MKKKRLGICAGTIAAEIADNKSRFPPHQVLYDVCTKALVEFPHVCTMSVRQHIRSSRRRHVCNFRHTWCLYCEGSSCCYFAFHTKI